MERKSDQRAQSKIGVLKGKRKRLQRGTRKWVEKIECESVMKMLGESGMRIQIEKEECVKRKWCKRARIQNKKMECESRERK